MIEKRIYVSGYWLVKSNIKKSQSVYMFGIERTFRLLRNSQLFFFTDCDTVKPLLYDLSKKFNIDLTVIHKPLQELPAKEFVDKIVDSAKSMNLSRSDINYDINPYSEKGIIHYFRDLKKAGEDNYRSLLLIWLSKILLVNETISTYSSINDRKLICWVDCTAEWFSHTRNNWNFSQQKLPLDKLSHYGGALYYMGNRMPIVANFLSGGTDVWEKLENEFLNEVKLVENVAYAHDEETLLNNILIKNPENFNTIGTGYAVKTINSLESIVRNITKKYVYYRQRLDDLWFERN